MIRSVRQSRFPQLLVTSLLVLALWPVAPRAADLFTEIYNRGAVKQRSMRSIRAKFTETTSSSLLARPIVAHGTIVAAVPARVAMTYTDPERKIVTMDEKTLTVRWPDRQEQERIDITEIQKRVNQYFTRASVDDLRSMFEIRAMADPARRAQDVIDMRPTRKQIQQGLQRLEIWIDRNTDLLTQMRLTFSGGDQKTIALEDTEINVPITDEMFKAGATASRNEASPR
jgi:outer membrane lipoprotein-sorting protein